KINSLLSELSTDVRVGDSNVQCSGTMVAEFRAAKYAILHATCLIFPQFPDY
ncbi:hypothetical protein WA026_015497, partial [Henosepilachna vigintioctopunctata]